MSNAGNVNYNHLSLYLLINFKWILFSVASQRWKYRSICCVPNFIIALLLLIFICSIAVILLETDAAHFHKEPTKYTTVFRSLFICMSCIIIFVLLSNLCTFLCIIKMLVISHQHRITNSFLKISSPKEDTCPSSLKNEVDMIVQMVSSYNIN